MSIRQAKSTTASFEVTLQHETNKALGYTSGDALSATVWPGDSRPQLFAPSVVWVTPPNKVRLTITSDNLSALEPGVYRVRVFCGSPAAAVAETDLVVEPAPGSQAASQTYCTMEDLRTLHPNIDQFRSKDDRQGFEEQRSLATAWFNRILESRVRDTRYLRTLITSNKIMLTDNLRHCVALKSISIIFAGRFATKSEGTNWQTYAAGCDAMAANMASDLKVGFDNNADGVAEFEVDLSVVIVR